MRTTTMAAGLQKGVVAIHDCALASQVYTAAGAMLSSFASTLDIGRLQNYMDAIVVPLATTLSSTADAALSSFIFTLGNARAMSQNSNMVEAVEDEELQPRYTGWHNTRLLHCDGRMICCQPFFRLKSCYLHTVVLMVAVRDKGGVRRRYWMT